MDAIETNTALQPGARVLFHGTGANADGTVDSGFLYCLSSSADGSDNWVKPRFMSFQASCEGKLLALAMGTPGAAGAAILTENVHPQESGMLLRGQAQVIVWGTAYPGDPIYGVDLFAGQMGTAVARPNSDGDIIKVVGTTLKVVKHYTPLFSEIIMDFSPDHSYIEISGSIYGR